MEGLVIQSRVYDDTVSDLSMTEEEFRRQKRRYRARRLIPVFGFLGPYFLLWVVFLAVPVVWSVWLSFNSGGIVEPARFVGIKNWSRTLQDDELKKSLINTAWYVVIAITVVFGLSISLALLLQRYRRWSNFFKLGLYIPVLVSPIMAGMIFFFLTHYDMGVLNLILQQLGLNRMDFLGDNPNALLTISALEIWRGLGFWVLFFLAGLENVPQDLLDAARVDGAKPFRRFRKVTVPVMRPLILFALVIALIFNFQLFDSVQVLTKGGPVLGTSTVVWFIYRRMFAFQDSGLAYATSVGLLVLVLCLTIVAYGVLGKKVGKK